MGGNMLHWLHNDTSSSTLVFVWMIADKKMENFNIHYIMCYTNAWFKVIR